MALLKQHKHELLVALQSGIKLRRYRKTLRNQRYRLKSPRICCRLVDLTQEQIDRIVLSVPQGVANIQDIYPLAPLQEGILFHHLLETQGRYLFITLGCRFRKT